MQVPVFFHMEQLKHKPIFEWAMGARMEHPETTRRAESILEALSRDTKVFEIVAPKAQPLAAIQKIHDPRLSRVYQTAESLPEGETFYPSVFPRRDQSDGNPDDIHQAGYFCFDSGTPLNSTTWTAAAWSAACAYEAAEFVAKGKHKLAYALSRPPGHHASKDLFGGYSYFNNAALAVKRLRSLGSVALLDIDFHHGNGTQQIFYRDPKVLVISIHGDPRKFYPFFCGFSEESGKGIGQGLNVNLPLPEGCDGKKYMRVLESKALRAIRSFGPKHLVVSAGFDTYKKDPIGRFKLDTDDFYRMAGRIAKLNLPTVVVQEGGYDAESLGRNVHAFLKGLIDEHPGCAH